MASTKTELTSRPAPAPLHRAVTVTLWLLGTAAFAFIAVNGQVGATEPRIANPNPSPEAIEAVAGLPDLSTICNIWTSVMVVTAFVAVVVLWRKHPGHPLLLLVLAGTVLVWLDPPANWVSYVAFNPDLWHFPVDWPWVSVAPLVQPFVCIAYASVLIAPAFAAIPILRRLQARRPIHSFVSRHPLITLAGIAFALGFTLDAVVEIVCIHFRIFAFTQVPEFGSVFVGEYNQFPLLWESGLASSVVVAATILVYRDDTGQTKAEQLSRRLRLFPTRPMLATFVTMIGVLSLAYFGVYGGGFLVIRSTKLATSVACPWPYPETKVYDPQGFYEEAGHLGPFFEGRGDGWLSGQPDGRPVIEGPIPAGRCGPGRP